jgi:hypothetical protein
MRNLSPRLFTSGKYIFLVNQLERLDTFNVKNALLLRLLVSEGSDAVEIVSLGA